MEILKAAAFKVQSAGKGLSASLGMEILKAAAFKVQSAGQGPAQLCAFSM